MQKEILLGYHFLNVCKTVRRSLWRKQIELVQSFDWIDFSKLNDIEDEISEIMSTEQAKEFLGDTRHTDIANFVVKRIKRLESFALQRQSE